jgi:hypothetical protein
VPRHGLNRLALVRHRIIEVLETLSSFPLASEDEAIAPMQPFNTEHGSPALGEALSKSRSAFAPAWNVVYIILP